MTDYYVVDSAPPGGDGGEALPWDALSDIAFGSIVPGDRILTSGYFAEQLTTATDGTIDAPVEFIGNYTGEKTIVDAELTRGLAISNTADDYIYYTGFDVRNADDGLSVGEGLRISGSTGCKLFDISGSGCRWDQIKIIGSSNVEVHNPVIVGNADGNEGRGVTVSGASASPSSNVIIINPYVTGMGLRGVAVSGDNGTKNVTNVRVLRGYLSGNGEGIAVDNCSNVIVAGLHSIQNNLTNYVGGSVRNMGLSVYNATDAVFCALGARLFTVDGNTGDGVIIGSTTSTGMTTDRLTFDGFDVRNNDEGFVFAHSTANEIINSVFWRNGKIQNHSGLNKYGIYIPNQDIVLLDVFNVLLKNNYFGLRLHADMDRVLVRKSTFDGGTRAVNAIAAQTGLVLTGNKFLRQTDRILSTNTVGNAWTVANNYYDLSLVASPVVYNGTTYNAATLTTFEPSLVSYISGADGFTSSSTSAADGNGFVQFLGEC